jgi:hypothetical protein
MTAVLPTPASPRSNTSCLAPHAARRACPASSASTSWHSSKPSTGILANTSRAVSAPPPPQWRYKIRKIPDALSPPAGADYPLGAPGGRHGYSKRTSGLIRLTHKPHGPRPRPRRQHSGRVGTRTHNGVQLVGGGGFYPWERSTRGHRPQKGTRHEHHPLPDEPEKSVGHGKVRVPAYPHRCRDRWGRHAAGQSLPVRRRRRRRRRRCSWPRSSPRCPCRCHRPPPPRASSRCARCLGPRCPRPHHPSSSRG